MKARARSRLLLRSLLLAIAVVAIIMVAAGRGGAGRQASRPIEPERVASTGAPPAPRPAAPAARAERGEVPPGSLPQTRTIPSGGDAHFRALMADLWRGIVTGSARPAAPAFFPLLAYEKLKAIPAAASDWRERLFRDYRLDIEAAHSLLGAGAAGARLLAVHVPSSYAHWIPPGVCYNDIGYYEMPNARFLYREHGATRSFGIASMISWHGVWYVVHLGAILRSSDTGQVDDPASGRGTSEYSGTC